MLGGVRFAALVLVAGAFWPPIPAHAVFSGEMSPAARSGDADYADGMEGVSR